jgi:dynein heavy chain, axonemal
VYSIIQSSRSEGIEVYAQKFSAMFQKVCSQPYQALDHRKPEFDRDYVEFKASVEKTEEELRLFMSNCLSEVPNVFEALRLLDRFVRLLQF